MHRFPILLITLILLLILNDTVTNSSAYHPPSPLQRYELDPILHHYPAPSANVTSNQSYLLPQGKISFQSYRTNYSNLFLINEDGSNEFQLTNDSHLYFSPVLKAGANKLVYGSTETGNYDLFTIESTGLNKQQLTNHPAQDLYPQWHPRDNQLLFESTRSGNSDIYLIDEDGSNLIQLTTLLSNDKHGGWSPDGTQIIFISDRSGTNQLWVMNKDGSDPHQLSFNAINPIFPAWSPDGSTIAYAEDHNEDSFFEIWLHSFNNNEQTELFTASGLIDLWKPTWSASSEWLSYIEVHWTIVNNQWYWQNGYLRSYHLTTAVTKTITTDNTIWSADWASVDYMPPTPCSFTNPSLSPQKDIPLQMISSDLESDIRKYDLLIQDGTTTPTLHSSLTSLYIHPSHSTQLSVKCRSWDHSHNVSNLWSDIPTTIIEIDDTLPHTTFDAPPIIYQQAPTITLNWSTHGTDSDMTTYTLSTRNRADKRWTRWLTDTVKTTAVFTAPLGSTIDFQIQATDAASHRELWTPQPKTTVHFYYDTQTILLFDNRGYPILNPTLNLITPINYEKEQHQIIVYRSTPTETLHFSNPAYAPFPPISLNEGKSIYLAPFYNYLQNPSFETGSLLPWNIIPKTVDPTYTPTLAYNGDYALLFRNSSNNSSHLSQIFPRPSSIPNPTLSLLYYIPNPLNETNLTISIKPTSSPTATTLFTTSHQTAGWEHLWFDLSQLPPTNEMELLLTLDGPGKVWLDHLQLGPWNSPIITDLSPEQFSTNENTVLTINGQNFSSGAELFLNEYPLENKIWLSPTQIVATVPELLPNGRYTLWLTNPSGQTTDAPVTLLATPSGTSNSYYFPFISHTTPNEKAAITYPTGWTTAGYASTHSGYNPTDSAASEYQLNYAVTIPNLIPQPARLSKQFLILTAENNLFALDSESGITLWSYTSTNPSLSPPLAPTIKNGLLYWVHDHELILLNLYTGTELKKISFPDQILAAPLIVEDQLFLPTTNALFAYQLQTMSLNWEQQLPMETTTRWIPAYSDGKIYSWVDGKITAYDYQTGSISWSNIITPIVTTPLLPTTPIIEDPFILLHNPTHLSVINSKNGALLWSTQGDYSQTQSAIGNKTSYSILDNQLTARELETGRILWSIVPNPSDTLQNQPVVAGNYIYLSGLNQSYIINRYTHQLKSTITHTGQIIVAQGWLYITDDHGVTHAYQAQQR